MKAVAAATALTASAFAQSMGENRRELGSRHHPENRRFHQEDFIEEAATSDMLEIEAPKIAQRRAPAESGRLDSIASEEGLRVNGALGPA